MADENKGKGTHVGNCIYCGEGCYKGSGYVQFPRPGQGVAHVACYLNRRISGKEVTQDANSTGMEFVSKGPL